MPRTYLVMATAVLWGLAPGALPAQQSTSGEITLSRVVAPIL